MLFLVILGLFMLSLVRKVKKNHSQAAFRHVSRHFLVDIATQNTMPKTACRNSKNFKFYDLLKMAKIASWIGFLILFLLVRFRLEKELNFHVFAVFELLGLDMFPSS